CRWARVLALRERSLVAEEGQDQDAWPPHAQQLGTRRQHRRPPIADYILGLATEVDDLADDLGNPSSARVRVRGDRAQGPDLRLDAGDLGLERRRLLGESLVGVCLRKLGMALGEFDHPLAAVRSDLAALLIAGADRLVDSALRRCDTLGDGW